MAFASLPHHAMMPVLFTRPNRLTRKQKRQRAFRIEQLERRRVLAGNPIISEFVASNLSGLEDGFGNDPDWIEIRNDADTAVDLLGYHLTDDASDLNRWEFPSSHVLNPGEYLVVFASGRNLVDPSGNFHTDFQLAAGGEYLALTSPDQTILSEYGSAVADYPAQIDNLSYGVSGGFLVSGNSVTQYLVPTDDSLGNSWIENGFDGLSNGFSLGRAAMGYETGNGYQNLILTTVPVGTTNVYQRVEFDLEDASLVSDLQLKLNYDDGVVVYLNGVQVVGENVPSPLSYNTPASAGHPDSAALAGTTYSLDGFVGELVDGKNTLAIHMLNRPDSSDFLLVPELSTQSISGQVGYLESPTPGETNAGLMELGPLVTNVESSTETASPGTPLVITANITDFTNPFDPSTAALHYRVMYDSEVTLPMVDDGTGDDAIAGDGIVTATIPGSVFDAGEMIRWYVTASDLVGIETRAPRFLDILDSAEYFGTVVADASITTDLPVMQWFVENPAAASTNNGTRASLYMQGEFFDNIQVDNHGQSTRGAAFPKKSFDFDANSGNKFRVRSDLDRVSDFNLLTNYADESKLRNSLTYNLFAEADYAHHFAFSVMVYRNGSLYGLYDLVEEGDTEYLDRLGFNSDNPLYKVNNRLDNAYNRVEKKSREYEDHSDFAEVVNAAQNLTGSAATDWDYDNLDIADFVNYLAIQNVVGSTDFGHKNMYWYRDTNGTRLWSALPWDQDLSLGHRWDASVSPPYFRDDLVTNTGLFSGYNNIFQRLYSNPTFRQMYTRRLRSLADQFYGVDGTSPQATQLGQHIAELEALTRDEAIANTAVWGIHPNFSENPAQAAAQLINEYIPLRRAYIDGQSAIPSSQPANPSIFFDDVDYDADPVSGLQSEEYIRLNNPNAFAVDISGWRLDGGIDHRFKGGTVIPAGGTLYVVKDVAAFLARGTGPGGGRQLIIQGNYEGQLTFTGETVDLISTTGAIVDTLQTPVGTPTTNQQFLRVTEVHYNPAVADTEFIELTNISSGGVFTTLDLSGVTVTDGPSTPFVFAPGTMLAPGERILIVQDPTAMLAQYPALDPADIAGQYFGKLSNSGERVKIVDAGGETIFDMDYGDSDPWPISSDGVGASLVLIDPTGTPFDQLSKPTRWRGSTLPGGTPAAASTPLAGIVINEVLTHTDIPALDAIELMNATSQPVDIGGWYLSDSASDLLRYKIPVGTVLPAGGYVVFDESDFNPTPLTPGANDFALSGSQGDEVWLTIPDITDTSIAQFVDQIAFGATFNGQTLGRAPNAIGRLVPQVSPSLGSENVGHHVSDVVISEVQYHPSEPTVSDLAIDPNLESADLEFIEIHNHSSSQVNLANWRLRGDGDFDFPPGTLLDAGAMLVVTPFDPSDPTNANRVDAFRNHYSVDSSVPLIGPFAGSLGNSYGRIRLQKPDSAPVDDPTTMPRVLVDEVFYDDLSPWPTDADGQGASLQRVSESALGNAASSWLGAVPTPGALRYVPHVEHVEINEGDSQRSMVDQITVTFDREVNVTGQSFEVRHRETNQTVGSLQVNSSVVDGKTEAVIRFGVDALVHSGTHGNSLIDGNYELLVKANETEAANGGGRMIEDFDFGKQGTDQFFRLYGDHDGDRDVDGLDLGRFGQAFLKTQGQEGYLSALDSDADGDIDGLDLGAFGQRFLQTMPF